MLMDAFNLLCLASRTASVVGPGEIDFQWAKFSPRDKAVAGMDVVLCAPKKADADIENADQLVGKMAVVYRGECTFQKKTERLIAAGAHGVIIINTEDDLFEAPPADVGYSAAIPVVMIKAKDATALLASGNSSCLGKPQQQADDLLSDEEGYEPKGCELELQCALLVLRRELMSTERTRLESALGNSDVAAAAAHSGVPRGRGCERWMAFECAHTALLSRLDFATLAERSKALYFAKVNDLIRISQPRLQGVEIDDDDEIDDDELMAELAILQPLVHSLNSLNSATAALLPALPRAQRAQSLAGRLREYFYSPRSRSQARSQAQALLSAWYNEHALADIGEVDWAEVDWAEELRQHEEILRQLGATMQDDDIVLLEEELRQLRATMQDDDSLERERIAPTSIVDRLPCRTSAAGPDEDEKECAVCLSQFEKGDLVRMLPCRHEFHADCIDKWLLEKDRRCSCCRVDVCAAAPPDHLPRSVVSVSV
jgi:hypothetical protein